MFAYPCIWEETSCISALEAMASGLYCVTTNYGALYETCGEFPIYVNYTDNYEKLAENFAEVTHGKDNFIAIYREATKKPYGFLFITMGSTPRFYSSYRSEFKISDEEDQ